jgi:hypothetical protein
MPIYTLYLSTLNTSPSRNQIIPVYKTNLANVSWNIDFNSLFRGQQLKHKNCRVRFSLNSQSWTAGGASDWAAYSGYLSANFQTQYNATTTFGTFLGMVTPEDSPITGSGNHVYVVSSLEQQGVDIIAPTDVQTLNLQFINDDSQTLITAVPEYAILLQFELYNPIE